MAEKDLKIENRTKNVVIVPLFNQTADGQKVKAGSLRLLPRIDPDDEPNRVSKDLWGLALRDKTFREGFVDKGLVAIVG